MQIAHHNFLFRINQIKVWELKEHFQHFSINRSVSVTRLFIAVRECEKFNQDDREKMRRNFYFFNLWWINVLLDFININILFHSLFTLSLLAPTPLLFPLKWDLVWIPDIFAGQSSLIVLNSVGSRHPLLLHFLPSLADL